MKLMKPILFLFLLLSVSSVALADKGHKRDGHDGHHGDRGHHAQPYGHRHDRRHYVRSDRQAHRHLHDGRYCHDWHSRGYVAPRVRYAYTTPGFVLVYQPGTGLYIAGGR